MKSEKGVGKNSDWMKRVRFPTPAQLIRSSLELKGEQRCQSTTASYSYFYQTSKAGQLLPSLFYLNYFTFAVLVITFTAFFTEMSCFNISGERRLRTCSTGML